MTALMTMDGDLALQNNNLVLTEDNSDQEIEQRIRADLRLFLGEWFLDITVGVPWIQSILVKGVDPFIAEALIKEAINNVFGVVGLVRFDPILFDTATRNLTVNFEVLTVNNTRLPIGLTT